MRRQNLLKMASVALACVALTLAACQTNPSSDPTSSSAPSATFSPPFPYSCSSSLVEAMSGVAMIIESVSASGMRFQLQNTTDTSFHYSTGYILCVQKGETWEPVEPITDKWVVLDIAYTVEPHSKTEVITIDWEWLFGVLPDGQYEIQKSMFTDDGTTATEYLLGQAFSIP